MNRREAINRVALLMGSVIISTEFFTSGCHSKSSSVDAFLDADQQALLAEVADTILPQSTSPGAKAAGVGEFMAVMVRDCYTSADQKVFIDGIKKLNDACIKYSGQEFIKTDGLKRTELLTRLNDEQEQFTKNKKKEEPNHYFRMMKELTLLGYFTSETGATKALRYLPVPGKYVGDYPYKKGDKAWALV